MSRFRHISSVSPIDGSLKSRKNLSVRFCAWKAQERILSDGTLSAGNNKEQGRSESYVIGSSVDGTQTTIPEGIPPVRPAELDAIVEFIQESSRGINPKHGGKRYCVALSGAGISTESGIPDYRSANGAYSRGFKPMTHQQFMASEENRSRYWARSFAGWDNFASMKPNEAHKAMARLQNNGYIEKIITQNVDRLHQKGGSKPEQVLELHGTTHNVKCTDCGHIFPRGTMQEWLSAHNVNALRKLKVLSQEEDGDSERLRLSLAGTSAPVRPDLRETPMQNPDGDVDIETSHLRFSVPACPSCTDGILKPDVVFFGDSLPPERSRLSMEIATNASGILVVGSSLSVMSAYRLVKQAKENGASICIITAGETRADSIADFKYNLLAGEVMPMVASRLSVPNCMC